MPAILVTTLFFYLQYNYSPAVLRRMLHPFPSIVLALATAFFVCRCDTPAEDFAEARKTFRMTIPLDSYSPQSDVFLATSGSESIVNDMIYESLFEKDPESLKPSPLLAAWKKNATETEWEFTLANNIYFHDGTIVSSADVIYSFEYVRNHEKSFLHPLTTAITQMAALDNHRFRITLNKPDGFFPYALMLINIVKKDVYAHGIPNTPIGTNALAFSHYDEKIKLLTLIPHPHKKDRVGNLQKVSIRFLANEEEGLALISRKQADFGYLIDTAYEAVFENNSDYKIVYQKMPLYYIISLNLNNPLLADPEKRKILNAFIDRGEMVKNIGAGPHSLTPITSLDWQSTKNTLDFGIYKNVANMQSMQDTPPLRLRTTSEHILSQKIVYNVMRQWAKNSFKSTTETMSFSKQLEDGFLWANTDAAIWLLNVKYLDFYLYTYWHSSMPHNQPWESRQHLDFDKELEALRQAVNPAEKQSALANLEKAVLNNPPFVFLFKRYVPMIISRRFNGYSNSPWEFPLEVKNLRVEEDR